MDELASIKAQAKNEAAVAKQFLGPEQSQCVESDLEAFLARTYTNVELAKLDLSTLKLNWNSWVAHARIVGRN